MGRIGNIPKSQLYATSGFNTFQVPPRQFEEETQFLDEGAMADAAEAVRDTEVAAAEPDVANLNKEKLLHMNIDELRVVAKRLDVPEREKITDQDSLVAAIQRCL
ncbi:MAG: hypothetical protein AB7G28_17155 [Pirellulales bacterium]